MDSVNTDGHIKLIIPKCSARRHERKAYMQPRALLTGPTARRLVPCGQCRRRTQHTSTFPSRTRGLWRAFLASRPSRARQCRRRRLSPNARRGVTPPLHPVVAAYARPSSTRASLGSCRHHDGGDYAWRRRSDVARSNGPTNRAIMLGVFPTRSLRALKGQRTTPLENLKMRLS